MWGFCSPLSHTGNAKRASVSPLIYSVGTGAGRDLSRVSRALGTPCAGQDGANRPRGAGSSAIPSRAQNTPGVLTHPHPRNQAGLQPLSTIAGDTGGGQLVGQGANPWHRERAARCWGGLRVWIWGTTYAHACPCWLSWGVHASVHACVPLLKEYVRAAPLLQPVCINMCTHVPWRTTCAACTLL